MNGKKSGRNCPDVSKPPMCYFKVKKEVAHRLWMYHLIILS